MTFEGISTALVTPFRNGEIDWNAFERLIERQLDAGISALIVCGTTAESPVLSKAEKKALIRAALERCGGRAAVMAGTGSNSTAESIAFSKWAVQQGVDALLLVVPYYNKPNQEGLYRHFEAVARAAAPTPVCLYNVPGRTVADLLPETIGRLAAVDNIRLVKEATGLMDRVVSILELAPKLTVLSGDDKSFFNGLRHGMKGIISVASNVFPERMIELHRVWAEGDLERAAALNERLAPLFAGLFCETNPVPVKAAAQILGHMEEEVRLPLVPLSPELKKTLQKVISDLLEKI